MPSKLIPLVGLFLLLAGTQLSAKTYYLDFTNGMDSNHGEDAANAWKNISKIKNTNPEAGDEFLFKRGEKWEVEQWYIDFSGTNLAPITFGVYGEASDDLPIISNIMEIAAATDPLSWTELSPNIWTLTVGSTPGRLFLDEIEYLRAATLSEVGTVDSEGSLGYWFYDAINTRLHLYATQNPATLYNTFKGGAHFYATLIGVADYLVFENLDFRGGTGASLAIIAGTNIEIRNCNLGHSGNSGILLLDAVIETTNRSTSHITIENNLFDSNFTFYYGLGSERGCGDGLRLRNGVNNCTATNNTFVNWAHNAIELLGDGATADGVNDNQFYDNHISAPDIPYAHPLGADGLAGKCQNNEFFRNYIENCRTASQINGNNNWVHHNIIVGMRRSPSKAQATAHAFILGIYGAGLVSENNRFDHNLIIDTDESAFLIRGYGYAGQVEHNLIRNNILYETGLAPYNNAYQDGTGFVIYDTNLDGVGGNTYQNNLFYSSDPSAEAVFIQDEATYYTSTEFNALNGTDGNTIMDNLTGDPLFTDLPNDNFLPMDNSPAVNAGIDVGLTLDYALQDRLVGPAPDIGPLETEVTTPLPIVWGDFWLQLVQQTVKLQWQTLTEINTAHFEVERSLDGLIFESIGRLKATGYSAVPRNYHFVDHSPPSGIIYYRLRQVDVDGAFEYSDLLSAEIMTLQPFKLIRTDSENLRIEGPDDWDWSNTQLLIFDQMGRKCMETKGTSHLSLYRLPAAVYLLVLKRGTGLNTFRFVKK